MIKAFLKVWWAVRGLYLHWGRSALRTPDRKLSVGRSRGMKQVEGDVADRHTLITLTHALHLVGSTPFSVHCSILLFA